MTPLLATEWAEAGRVALVGFCGVFAVLFLLYVCTLLYGAVARRLAGGSDGSERG